MRDGRFSRPFSTCFPQVEDILGPREFATQCWRIRSSISGWRGDGLRSCRGAEGDRGRVVKNAERVRSAVLAGSFAYSRRADNRGRVTETGRGGSRAASLSQAAGGPARTFRERRSWRGARFDLADECRCSVRVASCPAGPRRVQIHCAGWSPGDQWSAFVQWHSGRRAIPW